MFVAVRRYSAYKKTNVAYVCATTHPLNPAFGGSKTPDGEPSSTLEEDVRATCRRIDFQGLTILERKEDGDEAELKITVDFRVTGQKGYRQKGAKPQSFTELARFARVEGEAGPRWLYLGGQYL